MLGVSETFPRWRGNKNSICWYCISVISIHTVYLI